MSHIFISYSKKNKIYARALADHLEAKGFKVWIDDEIDYGEVWERKMFSAIDDCAAFVVIMTPEAYKSDWVLRECEYASRKKKPQFPLLLDGEEFPRYMTHQWLDVRDRQLPSEEFLSTLARYALRGTEQDHMVSVINTLYREKNDLLTKRAFLQDELDELVSKSIDLSTPPPTFNLPLLEWCYIPAGKVTIEGIVCTVDAFWLAKYPVTYAQYEAFVKDNGYDEKKYWTDFAWNWKRATQTTRPGFWENSKWHVHNHPLTGVSWYEAIAFTKWLSEKMSWDVRLPNEKQWQWAAQGDDGRTYPWGNIFDSKRCNFRSDEIAPVDKYPSGVSPFGVIDMTGNVREMCLTVYKQPYDAEEDNRANLEINRVLRGGSWRDADMTALRVDVRASIDSGSRGSTHGFRVCAIHSS
jgi:hypothetical protein